MQRTHALVTIAWASIPLLIAGRFAAAVTLGVGAEESFMPTQVDGGSLASTCQSASGQ